MYFEYLKNLLSPLRLYDMENLYGRAELEVLGGSMDLVWSGLETHEKEMLPLTAEGYGLAKYQELLPYSPASDSMENRQKALAALLRIDNAAFTPAAMRDTLAGCGLEVAVEEGEGQNVTVSFPGVRGIPENILQLQQRVENILPCHLEIEYKYLFLTWAELESGVASWAELEDMADSWAALERLAL